MKVYVHAQVCLDRIDFYGGNPCLGSLHNGLSNIVECAGGADGNDHVKPKFQFFVESVNCTCRQVFIE